MINKQIFQVTYYNLVNTDDVLFLLSLSVVLSIIISIVITINDIVIVVTVYEEVNNSIK